jgi:hypothetical protein
LVAPDDRIEEVAATVVPEIAPVEATLVGVNAPAAVNVVPEKPRPPARLISDGTAPDPVGFPRRRAAVTLCILA